jgi:hypothetical protein
MVEIEESAQAVASLHVGVRSLRQRRVLQKPVVESLMIPLAVVVLDVLAREEAQVALTERDHSIETFLFDRPNEPFGVRLEIGTSWSGFEALASAHTGNRAQSLDENGSSVDRFSAQNRPLGRSGLIGLSLRAGVSLCAPDWRTENMGSFLVDSA